MFDEYRIDVYLTDGYNDADQPNVIIDRTETGNREQAHRYVMDGIARFAPWDESSTTHTYWAGYAAAMFDCTDPGLPMFLDDQNGSRVLSIAIRPV